MNVLIYYNEKNLKPVGGSAGYLYYLRRGMVETGEIKDIKIDFIPESGGAIPIAVAKNTLYEKLPNCIREARKIVYEKRKNNRLISENVEHISNIDFNKYDVIHFHSTTDLFSVRDSLNKFKGKVLLTSHSPKPFYREIFEDNYDKLERFFLRGELKRLESIDRYAFERADYLVFPCEEAKEPYKKWSYFNTISPSKFIYMASGACLKEADDVGIRNELGIAENDFVCAYVGRHNEVKGYDLLIQYIKPYVASNKIQMVVCGKEEPIEGPKIDNWHEIGWTNKAMSYVKAADLFILPNRETYFDLVLLEVLSIGTVCLISETGGNKFFKLFSDKSGVFLYKNENEFCNQLNKIMKLSKDERERISQNNRELFQEYFSEKAFYNRYIRMLFSLQN